jgi:cytosine/adenosine deaminase-related metal-dependent hydrolase
LFPYTTTPDGLEGVYDIAEKYDVMMTTHVAETEHEVEGYQTPVEYLDTVGALGDRSLLGHCVYLSDRDIRLLDAAGATVSHNPLTNMALGAGHAPVPKMREYGVTVGLGTDNSSASDTANMLNDLRFAALIHKGHHCDPSIVTAEQTLRMATIDAARAIGRSDDLGSITPGKKADIAVLDFDYPHLTPHPDPVSTLVYQTQGHEVETVVCNGELVLEDGEVTGISATYPDLLDTVTETAERVAERVGLPEPVQASAKR